VAFTPGFSYTPKFGASAEYCRIVVFHNFFNQWFEKMCWLDVIRIELLVFRQEIVGLLFFVTKKNILRVHQQTYRCFSPMVVNCIEQREALSERVHRRHLCEAEHVSNGIHWALPRHEHMLVEKLREHSQRTVRHDHLVLIDLLTKRMFHDLPIQTTLGSTMKQQRSGRIDSPSSQKQQYRLISVFIIVVLMNFEGCTITSTLLPIISNEMNELKKQSDMT
jgi:hypothetical protein